MSPTLDVFFERLVPSFLEGDMISVSRYLRYPCPVFFRDETLVLAGPAELASALCLYRARLMARGMSEVNSRVVCQSLPKNSGTQVWQTWLFLDEKGAIIESNHGRYICGLAQDGNYQIELCDYQQITHPSQARRIPEIPLQNCAS